MTTAWEAVLADFAWISTQIDALRAAGFGYDPTLEIVVVHPAVLEGADDTWILGCKAEHGKLGVKVAKRE